MKVSMLFGGVTTALLAGFPLAQGAPLDTTARQDFSADFRNFGQVQLMLYNIRSRIGIPFTAMRNVSLNFNQTLEVKPLDLVLLPNGYCFSCSTSSHDGPDYAKRPNPFRNEMVELDESQLLIGCTDDSAGDNSDEWPLMKACPGQEEVLRTFLLDASSHGSRIAIPKAQLENAPVFEVRKHICMPKYPEQTTCSITPSFAPAPATVLSLSLKLSYAEIALSSRLIDLKTYISSIYRQKTLPNTEGVSMASSTPAATNVVTSSTLSGPKLTKSDANSAPSSMTPPSTNQIDQRTSKKTAATFTLNSAILSSTNHIDQQAAMKPKTASDAGSPVPSIIKPAERPRSTPLDEQWPIPPTYASPASANDGNNRSAAMYSMRTREQAEAASRSFALAAAASASAISAPTPPVENKNVVWPSRRSVKPKYQPTWTAIVVMQRMESMPTTSSANDADPPSTNEDCLDVPSTSQQGPMIGQSSPTATFTLLSEPMHDTPSPQGSGCKCQRLRYSDNWRIKTSLRTSCRNKMTEPRQFSTVSKTEYPEQANQRLSRTQ